ncbi:MAG: SDR family NAD(P)-dependent oxidoreductase, partial [Acidobacteria bacterium]|nr:SDR family NAD(P)-dependent oxidoreductase [Acidobacteriota bacterium]
KTEQAVKDIRATVPDARLEVVATDLGSLASVESAAGQIASSHPSIDLLVNNAGIMGISESKTADGFETQFGVNHLGHWALTSRLLPQVLAAPAARVVTVTSTAHHLGRSPELDNPHLHGRYKPWRAYYQSKLANFHFGIGLQHKLAGAGAPASSLIAHPGLSDTNLQTVSVEQSDGEATQRFFLWLAHSTGMSPAEGALPQLRAATDPNARGGAFYAPRYMNTGPPVRRPILRKVGMDKAIERLWEISERETGLTVEPAAVMGAATA